MAILNSILMSLYVAIVLFGAWNDARELRIPNWVSMTLMVAFFAIAVSASLPLETITWHVAAGIVTLVAGIVLFALGYFGGGDAKLIAACALWVGWDQVLPFIFAVMLTGGVLSIFVVLLRKGLGLWPDWLVRCARGLFTPNKSIPYGIAIALGAMIVLPRMDVLPGDWRALFNVWLG